MHQARKTVLTRFWEGSEEAGYSKNPDGQLDELEVKGGDEAVPQQNLPYGNPVNCVVMKAADARWHPAETLAPALFPMSLHAASPAGHRSAEPCGRSFLRRH